MAGITDYGRVKDNHHQVMWAECGIQFRANMLEGGGEIPLHAHDYDHVALISQGWFEVVEILPSGEKKEYQVAAKGHRPVRAEFNPVGYRVTIPAHHQHTFRLIEGPGEVLCMWAA